MMATLTAIAVASSSVAIRPFCAHRPSLAPDLGEVERPRPWPPLNLAHGCSTSPSPRSGRWRGQAVAMGEAGIPVLRCRGPPAGDWFCVVVGGGICGLCIAARSPFFGTAFVESESGARLESAKKMERSTPVRNSHTSTSDLLTWSETPPPHDSVAPGSASSRSNACSHQPSDGISKVVLGGQVTAEKSENLNKRKSCSAYKLKEITGSGIFAVNGEDDLLEPGSANPTSNNKTGLKMYQVLHNIAIIEYFCDGCLDPRRLLEVLNNVNVWQSFKHALQNMRSTLSY